MLQNYRPWLYASLVVSFLAAWPLCAAAVEPPELPGKPAPRSGKTYQPLDTPSVPVPDPARDIFAEMERMQREMDELFHRQFSLFDRLAPMPGLTPFGSGAPRGAFRQSLNIRDEGRHYVAEIQLPEQTGSEVDVRVDGNMLTVRSRHESRRGENRQGFASTHHSSSSFQQSFSLPGPVRAEQMEVEHGKNGRVTVKLPKA